MGNLLRAAAVTAAAISMDMLHERPTGGNYVVVTGSPRAQRTTSSSGTADTAGLQQQIDSLFAAVRRLDVGLLRGIAHQTVSTPTRTDSVDRYIEYCIDISREVSQLSGGMFDITIKPVTQAWGFAGKRMAEEAERRLAVAAGRL